MAATSRIDLTPEATTRTGVRESAVRSADSSKLSAAPRCTPPSPPVAAIDTPTAWASAIVAATVVAPLAPSAAAGPRSRALSLAARRAGSASRAQLVSTQPDDRHAVDHADRRGDRAGGPDRRLALGGHLQVVRRRQAVHDDGRLEGDDRAPALDRVAHLLARRGLVAGSGHDGEVYCLVVPDLPDVAWDDLRRAALAAAQRSLLALLARARRRGRAHRGRRRGRGRQRRERQLRAHPVRGVLAGLGPRAPRRRPARRRRGRRRRRRAARPVRALPPAPLRARRRRPARRRRRGRGAPAPRRRCSRAPSAPTTWPRDAAREPLGASRSSPPSATDAPSPTSRSRGSCDAYQRGEVAEEQMSALLMAILFQRALAARAGDLDRRDDRLGRAPRPLGPVAPDGRQALDRRGRRQDLARSSRRWWPRAAPRSPSSRAAASATPAGPWTSSSRSRAGARRSPTTRSSPSSRRSAPSSAPPGPGSRRSTGGSTRCATSPGRSSRSRSSRRRSCPRRSPRARAALVLDVKVGRGAFMKPRASARSSSRRTMVGLGEAHGVATVAQLTVDGPAARARRRQRARGGRVPSTSWPAAGPADVRELTLALARLMLELVGAGGRPRGRARRRVGATRSTAG